MAKSTDAAVSKLINKSRPAQEQGESTSASSEEQKRSSQPAAAANEAAGRLADTNRKAEEASQKVDSLAKSISSQFKLFGQQIQQLTKQQSEQQLAVSEAQSAAGDASKVLSKLNSYAGNIASNIQNIANQMGAYVTTLKETREALQDERETTSPKGKGGDQPPGAKRGLLEQISGASSKGGILGMLGRGFLSGAGRAAWTHAKRAGKAVAGGAKSVGQAAAKGSSAILKMLANPKMLVVGLVAAIGTGIYKYFTDDEFKKTVSDFFAKALDLGKEYILDPLMNMFSSMKEGLYNIIADVFEFSAGISIPVPEFLQKFGLPAKLEPFSFLSGAAQDLRASAAESKKSREAPAAEGGAPAAAPSGETSAPAPSAAAGASAGAATPAAAPPASAPDAKPVAREGKASESTAAAPAAPAVGGDDKATMEMIKQHEGVRYRPYKDSLGLWTIGVGHLIGDGKTLPPEMNREFTKEEVDAMFATDYIHHKKAAEKIPGFSQLGKEGQAGLIDMTFNMGPSWFKKWPNFIKSLSSGDVSGAVENLTSSAWYKQVKGRAVTVVNLIKSGMQKMTGGGGGSKTSSTGASAGSGMPTGAAAPSQGDATKASAPPATSAAAPAAATKKDSSLAVAAPTSGAAGAATAVASEPSSGSDIAAASVEVADKKNAPAAGSVVVDNSTSSSGSSLTAPGGGAIPSPIANRGTLDQFNYFNPPGQMKK